MASVSPSRPTRRATRKPLVVDDESEDELSLIQEDRDEEFTPAPQQESQEVDSKTDNGEPQHVTQEVCPLTAHKDW